MSDKFLFVNGMKLRYQEINPEASRPLVLLNGIGANLETWTPLLPHLGDRHVVMIDVPGVGKSPYRFFPRTLDFYANEIAKATYELGLDDFDLAGYSWGGACAQEFVRLHPERVNNLILISTTPGFEGKMPESSVIAMASSPARHYSREIAKRVAPFIHGGDPKGEDIMLKYLTVPNPIGFTHQVAAIAHWAGKKRPVNHTHRTLVLSGNRDPLIPHKNSLVLNQLFKKSQLYIASGGGHLWVITEPDHSGSIISTFLDA